MVLSPHGGAAQTVGGHYSRRDATFAKCAGQSTRGQLLLESPLGRVVCADGQFSALHAEGGTRCKLPYEACGRAVMALFLACTVHARRL